MTQQDFRRQQYVEARLTIAKFEAEAWFDEHFGELLPAASGQPPLVPGSGGSGQVAPPTAKETYTFAEAAELLGVSVPTLRRREAEGKIARAVGGKGEKRVFRAETLQTYLAGRRRAGK